MPAFLSQILWRFVKPSGGFPIAASPTRPLSHMNPFWDHMAKRAFRRLKHPELMPEVYRGTRYSDGVRVNTEVAA